MPFGAALLIRRYAAAEGARHKPFSMGLRPRLNADSAFAAFWNPGLAPRNDPFPNRRVVVLGRVAHAAAAHGPEREPKESP